MPESLQPVKLTVRAYKVGFGDCFLLTFHYPGFDRHVLVDFGSSGTNDDDAETLMLRIAEDIGKECAGKLHAIVATHRHKDHISGFATRKDGKGPGDMIATLRPDVVIQPWTEDPNAAPDAKTATTVEALAGMHAFAASLVKELPALTGGFSRNLVRQLGFLGDSNLKNQSAIDNLQRMGSNHYYVNFGSASGLETLLPGVTVHVLGPPNLEQSSEIQKQRSADAAEFWHLQAGAQEFSAGTERLFPGAAVYAADAHPPNTRWFTHKMLQLRGEQLLGIVRSLDSAMNNTSVILLFEAGGKKFLFSGDAQIENWNYALSKPEVQKLLADVDFYKVGHHGSLNATPISLWNLFSRRSEKPAADRLTTTVSTMAGKHGDARSGTEVPRKKLIDALTRDSDFHTTQDIKGKEIREVIEVKLNA